MNKRLLTILVLAFIIAGVCAFLVWRMLGNRLGQAQAPATTRIVAAASDIKLGTVLAASNLSSVEIAGSIPKGAILDKDKASLIGRGVISDLYQGEPILDSRLAPAGSGGGLAATIPPGMRACAVKVDEVVGVAGFATPGMHVDVLVSGTPPDANQPNTRAAEEGTQVRTILQNIAVLSAGTDIQKDAEGKPKPVQVVNLLVTPDQAEVLSLASGAKIQLVLRNPLDTKTDPVQGTAMLNLFTGGKPAPVAVKHIAAAPKAPAPKPFSVEVINGTKHTDTKFSSPEAKQ